MHDDPFMHGVIGSSGVKQSDHLHLVPIIMTNVCFAQPQPKIFRLRLKLAYVLFAFSSNNQDKCLFRPTSAENFSAEVEVGICVEKMACAFSSLTF